MSNIQKIIIPDGLTAGDKIGVAAPAGMVDIDEFHQGADILKTLGFEVIVPDDLFSPSSFLAGSDLHRATIFNRMVEAREIKAVFCARGGFGAMRTLPLIDFDLIQSHPKMVIGFSDITALLVNIYQKSGIQTLHGPVVTTLTDASEKSLSALKDALVEGQSYQVQFDQVEAVWPGRAEGPIIGGNLATLCHLTGTPFMPSYEDHILFIEDIGEPLYKIDRMLTQMDLAGCFKKVRGLAVGSFENCDDIHLIYDLIHEKFEKYRIPVIAGLPVGHIPDNTTLPIGVFSIMDADNGTWVINP